MAHYSLNLLKIKNNISTLCDAFKKKDLNFKLFYSVKTNYIDTVLNEIFLSRNSFEIVSRNEWVKVKKFSPLEIVLNGPNKNIALVTEILNSGSLIYFIVENDTDIEILKELDSSNLEKIKVGIRVYCEFENSWSRFGYDMQSENFSNVIKNVKEITNIDGIHFHSSIINPFKIEYYRLILKTINKITKRYSLNLKYLDIGGGFPEANSKEYQIEMYEKIPSLVKKYFGELFIISECGRNIVADTMSLNSEIVSLKKISNVKYDVTVDVNIMHFETFWEKRFNIEYLSKSKSNNSRSIIEIYGNSCMQIDKISNELEISSIPVVGDRIIIHNIGGYSHSMSAKDFITFTPKVKFT